MAKFDARDVKRLLGNPGIIRSQSKIKSSIGNAQVWLKIMQGGKGSFRDFIWQHTNHRTMQNRFTRQCDIPTQTEESRAMAKALQNIRLQILRSDHLLCVHAGRWHDQ